MAFQGIRICLFPFCHLRRPCANSHVWFLSPCLDGLTSACSGHPEGHDLWSFRPAAPCNPCTFQRIALCGMLYYVSLNPTCWWLFCGFSMLCWILNLAVCAPIPHWPPARCFYLLSADHSMADTAWLLNAATSCGLRPAESPGTACGVASSSRYLPWSRASGTQIARLVFVWTWHKACRDSATTWPVWYISARAIALWFNHL